MNQLPAYLQNRQSRGLAQSLVANLGIGAPPFLSIMGNRLNLIDAVGEEIPVATYDPKIGPYLDCVIIDALERTSKIYYDKAFDPGANQYEPPACFSDNGIAPSRNAAKPQSATCASCQWNAWGSKTSLVSGKAVKACNDIQKIALLVPGYEMPFLLRVPPNSRTNFRGYVNKFVGQPMDIADVTTRISFEPGVLGTLHFEAVGWLDEQTVLPQRDKLLEAKATDALIGRTDMPREGGLPAAAAPQQIEHQPVAIQQQHSAPAMQTQSVQQTAQPQPEQRRRRRNTQEAPQAPVQQPVAIAPAQAPFMAQQAPAAAPQGNGAGFGMAEGAAPNAALQNTLDGLFGKK